MKKWVLLYFVLCLCTISKAQNNLVPNGDFEIHDTCPNLYSNKINYALGWTVALQTTDYFNSCATYSPFLIPNNERGYQQDYHNGQGYAGILVFDNDAANGYARECMQIKLIDTLKQNIKYLASMYVSKGNDLDYAIATIGMLFTDTIINLGTTQGIIYANPQVHGQVLLADTLNWTLVQDTFIATGNEAYLTIGNFNTTGSSDTVNVYRNWQSSIDGAYYYIDGVSVYDITGVTCNTYWNAGYNKYIIAGDSIQLGAINADNSTYTWQNSIGGNTYLSKNTDARPWCKPTKTTTYYITKTCPNNNVFKDTVTVYVQQATGIEQWVVNSEQLSVYPNPASSSVQVSVNSTQALSISIYDLLGNEIINTKEKKC